MLAFSIVFLIHEYAVLDFFVHLNNVRNFALYKLTIIIHWAATAGYPEMITAVITFEIVVSLHKGRHLYLAREI